MSVSLVRTKYGSTPKLMEQQSEEPLASEPSIQKRKRKAGQEHRKKRRAPVNELPLVPHLPVDIPSPQTIKVSYL